MAKTDWEKRVKDFTDPFVRRVVLALLREFAEEAAAMLRQMSDSHGAIDLQRTAEQRREDYAAQRVLITAASKILSLLPPKKEA